MESMSVAWGRRSRWLFYSLVGVLTMLLLGAMAIPNMLRSRMAVPRASMSAPLSSGIAKQSYEQADVVTPEREALARGAAGVTALDRKVIRKGTVEVVVDNPATALERIAAIARQYQGYVVSSELVGRQENQHGNITIRVPASHFDDARAELKKLAKRIETEQTSADDVTMQYAENEATLRNYRAEEASYLQIMQHAGSIKDTLQVAEELSDVRGRIERLGAEMRTMSMQTEMTAIQVSVNTEPVVAAPVRWRPIYELRTAWNDGVGALTDYFTAMMAILLYIPAVLAWIATILIGGKLTWMLVRFGWRFLSGHRSEATA